jgi:hypothetical protein
MDKEEAMLQRKHSLKVRSIAGKTNQKLKHGIFSPRLPKSRAECRTVESLKISTLNPA